MEHPVFGRPLTTWVTRNSLHDVKANYMMLIDFDLNSIYSVT